MKSTTLNYLRLWFLRDVAVMNICGYSRRYNL